MVRNYVRPGAVPPLTWHFAKTPVRCELVV
jgi:hypothetical protein